MPSRRDPLEVTQGAPSSAQLSEEAWAASLPSWSSGYTGGIGASAGQGAPTTAAAPPAAPVSAPVGARLSAPLSAPVFAPAASAAGHRATAFQNWTLPPSHGNTAAVWWLVFMQLIYAVVQTAVMIAILLPMLPGISMTMVDNGILLANFTVLMVTSSVVSVAFLVVTIWIAFVDRRALERLGHTHTASPWWNLLGTLWYLIIRSVHVRRITGAGAAPLVTYICLYIVPGIALGLMIALYRGSGNA